MQASAANAAANVFTAALEDSGPQEIQFHVCTWNVQLVARADQETFLQAVDSMHWDVLLIQEWAQSTKFCKTRTTRGHWLYTTDNSAAGHGWGVGILVHSRWASAVSEVHQGTRCLLVELQIGDVCVAAISSHLPPAGPEHDYEHAVDEIYRLANLKAGRCVFLGLDANCSLAHDIDSITGPYALGMLQPRSQLLLELLYGLNLCVPSTFHFRRAIDQHTHVHSGGRVAQIDFVCCPFKSLSAVRGCFRVDALGYLSDHYCEQLIFKLKAKLEPKPKTRRRISCKWACRDATQYRNSLDHAFEVLNVSIPEKLGQIAECILSVAAKCSMRFSPRRALDIGINALRRLKQATTVESTRRSLTKQIWCMQKTYSKEKHDDRIKFQISTRTGWGKRQDQVQSWMSCPHLQENLRVLSASESVLAFETFYEKLFAEFTPLTLEIWKPLTPREDDGPFNLLQVKDAIQKLRVGVASGSDGVCASMLRDASDQVIERARLAFNRRYHGAFDDSWSSIVVTLLPKTAGSSQVPHFRPISLLDTLYKTYETLLIRLCPEDTMSKIDDCHFGFRSGYQALEAISGLRLLSERQHEFRRPMVVCKSDIYKAFDTLSHESINQAFRHYNIDPCICSAFLREIRGNPLTFRLPEGLFTKGVPQGRGVRQGGSASPFLFVLTLSFILLPLREKWALEQRGISLSDGTQITCFIFADDVIVVSTSWTNMTIMMNELLQTLQLHGLCIQPEKCCAMSNKFTEGQGALHVHDIEVPVVLDSHGFKFLGTIFTLDNQYTAEIRNRIAAAWAAFWRLRRWLMHRKANRTQRLELWRVSVRPTLFWASGSWRLSRAILQEIRVLERRMFRKVFMPPRVFGENAWDFLFRSARLLEKWLRNSEALGWVTYSKLQTWRWAGHLGRLEGSRLAKKILLSEGANWRALLRAAGAGQQHNYRSWHPRWEHCIEKHCEQVFELPWTVVAETTETTA